MTMITAQALQTQKKSSKARDTKAYDNYMNYRYCYDNGHDEWVAKARICFDFWRSRQWLDSDRALMVASNRPALTFNMIFALVRTMKGIQKALRNDVRFMPVADAGMEDAEVRDALWLSISNANQLLFLESDVWEKGLITGRAYYDLGVEFDDNMRGNITIDVPRSQDIVLDPCVDKYSAAKWPQFYRVPWVTLTDIDHMFGPHAARELANHPTPEWFDYDDVFMGQRLGRLPFYTYGDQSDLKLQRAYRLLTREYRVMEYRDVFVDLRTGETKQIPRSWERERVQKVLDAVPGLGTANKRIQTIRTITTCENTVLMDEESPFDVFSIVPFFPTFVDGETRGAVEDLIDPQMLLNKMTSQELAIINTTANSGWITQAGNLVGITKAELEKIGSKPGFVLTVKEIEKTQKITANGVPQGHEKLSVKAEQILGKISGVSPQIRGFAREDVAGEAIEANQAASDLNFADWLDNLHRSKQDLAHAVQSLWRVYYDETRTLLINHGSSFRQDIRPLVINQPTPEGDVLNDITDGRFSTVLVPAPTRSTLSNSDFKDLVMLKKELGVKIPDDALIEASNVGNKLQLIQRIQGDSSDHAEAQRQAELRQQQLEAATEEAKAEKERTAAQLNAARARKFAAEAETDPDEAYREVENRRISVDADIEHRRLDIDEKKLQLQHQENLRRTAVDLTKVELEQRARGKDREHDIEKTKLQAAQKRAAQPAKAKPKAKPKAKTKPKGAKR